MKGKILYNRDNKTVVMYYAEPWYLRVLRWIANALEFLSGKRPL